MPEENAALPTPAGIADSIRQLVKIGGISNDFEIPPLSRADRIRTCDLLTPSQTRYQAALRPELFWYFFTPAKSRPVSGGAKLPEEAGR